MEHRLTEPRPGSHLPGDGALIDFVPRIAVPQELRRALFVGNASRLYRGA